MTFGKAIELLKAGRIVRRAGWSAINWLVYVEGTTPKMMRDSPYGRPLIFLKQDELHVTILPHIDCHTEDGMQPGWTPSQSDMLAGDWMLIDMDNLPQGEEHGT